MFNWYVNGIQRDYEPRSTTPVARVTSATRVTPVDPDARTLHTPYEQTPMPAKRQPALLVSQIMTSPVSTLPSSAELNVVVELFRTRRFRHVPVVSEAGKVVGIISDRDVLKYLSSAFDPFTHSTKSVQVSEVMSNKVLVARPDTAVREVAKLMFEERIGCLPILDDAQNLVGIVTRSDILRTVMNNAPLELWV